MLELGQVLYNAVGKATEFRSPSGEPLPRWDVLPPEIQQAWAAGVQAIFDHLTPHGEWLTATDILPFDEPDVQYKVYGGNWQRRKA